MKCSARQMSIFWYSFLSQILEDEASWEIASVLLCFWFKYYFLFYRQKCSKKVEYKIKIQSQWLYFAQVLKITQQEMGEERRKNLFVMVINNMVGVLYHRRGEHCNTTIREKVDPLCIRFDCICVAVSVLYLIGFGNAFFFLSLSCYFAMFFRRREKTNFLIWLSWVQSFAGYFFDRQ